MSAVRKLSVLPDLRGLGVVGSFSCPNCEQLLVLEELIAFTEVIRRIRKVLEQVTNPKMEDFDDDVAREHRSMTHVKIVRMQSFTHLFESRGYQIKR